MATMEQISTEILTQVRELKDQVTKIDKDVVTLSRRQEERHKTIIETLMSVFDLLSKFVRGKIS